MLFTQERLEKLCLIVKELSKLEIPIEGDLIRNACKDDEEYRFVMLRLANIGMVYFDDLGVNDDKEMKQFIERARQHYLKTGNEDAFKTEVSMLTKKPMLLAGGLTKMPDEIILADDDLYFGKLEEPQFDAKYAQYNTFVKTEDGPVYYVYPNILENM